MQKGPRQEVVKIMCSGLNRTCSRRVTFHAKICCNGNFQSIHHSLWYSIFLDFQIAKSTSNRRHRIPKTMTMPVAIIYRVDLQLQIFFPPSLWTSSTQFVHEKSAPLQKNSSRHMFPMTVLVKLWLIFSPIYCAVFNYESALGNVKSASHTTCIHKSQKKMDEKKYFLFIHGFRRSVVCRKTIIVTFKG